MKAVVLSCRGLKVELLPQDGVVRWGKMMDTDTTEVVIAEATRRPEGRIVPPVHAEREWRVTSINTLPSEHGNGAQITFRAGEATAEWICAVIEGGVGFEVFWILTNDSNQPLVVNDPVCLELMIPEGMKGRIRCVAGDRDRDNLVRPVGSLYETFRRYEEEWSPRRLETGNLRSAVRWLPFVELLEREADRGVWIAFAWSGRWFIDLAETDHDGMGVVRVGQGPQRRELQPGETWRSPRAAWGRARGEGSPGQVEWVKSLIPPAPEDFPLVVYNTWFSHMIGLDEETLAEELDAASRVGAEVFCVDAGWYLGCGASGAFHSGLGDWRENREKFPSGLKVFSERVKDRGLRFGLWFEPERVDPATAGPQRGGWDRSWLATNTRQPDFPPHRSQLCFGHEPVRTWAAQALARCIEAYGIEWLKVDYNTWLVCDRTDHTHDAGDGDHAHAEGLYEVLDHLRTRFPRLIIENCAAGGARLEPGLATHTHVGWVSDHIHYPSRVRHHFWGASRLFPPYYLHAWMWDGKPGREDVADELPRRRFDYMVRSRMLGAFGMSCRLSRWPAWTLQRLGRLIEVYKEHRSLLRWPVTPLTPQSPLPCGLFEQAPTWEAYQYWNPSRHEGSIWLFRGNHDADTCVVRLKHLRPEQDYVLVDSETGAAVSESGARLTDEGWEAKLEERWSSAVWWIRRPSN